MPLATELSSGANGSSSMSSPVGLHSKRVDNFDTPPLPKLNPVLHHAKDKQSHQSEHDAIPEPRWSGDQNLSKTQTRTQKYDLNLA